MFPTLVVCVPHFCLLCPLLVASSEHAFVSVLLVAVRCAAVWLHPHLPIAHVVRDCLAEPSAVAALHRREGRRSVPANSACTRTTYHLCPESSRRSNSPFQSPCLSVIGIILSADVQCGKKY